MSSFVNVFKPAGGGPYGCPCCGYLTLGERGGFEICDVCFWEDDGQDAHDADVVRGGPNGPLSLTQARLNFAKFGACSERHVAHVRPPTAEEHPLR
ncbi:CPCC family cysteine-rich protein [Kribbella sp. CA-294648]|uniref:CPCC family cysteine-rich protein n=1 Tax=Kribbella sp. CA-294648 TaxID=3239948 RepID=UPI003D8E3998